RAIPIDINSITDKYNILIFYNCFEQMFTTKLYNVLMNNISIDGIIVKIGLDTDALKHLLHPEIKGPDADNIKLGPVKITWPTAVSTESGNRISIESVYSESHLTAGTS